MGLPTLRMSKHQDLVIDEAQLVIPRNTTIWIPLGLPHASSAIYHNADQFLPERWLEANAEYMPTMGEAQTPSLMQTVVGIWYRAQVLL